MAGAQQPGMQAATAFQPQQHPIANQPKKSGDPWDWGSDNVDNGNDAWNWSVDQQSEPQQLPPPQSQLQQQPQQPQQQQQFVASYPNNMQAPPNPSQESYYQNLNGNNRPPPSNPPHPGSGGNTPRTGPSRESTPHQSDNYSSYPNYSTNQQHPVQQRPNSTKAGGAVHSGDQAQWAAGTQPPQQLQQPQLVDHTDRQAPPFNPYFQTNPPTFDTKGPPTPLQQHPPVVNNYNWNSVEQPNMAVQRQAWQNHTEFGTGGYWQDNANLETESQYKNSDNQWQGQPRHVQAPQVLPTGSNAPASQWQAQNQQREAEQISQRQQLPLGHQAGVAQVSWNQPKSLNASQSWQQGPPPHQPESLPGHWPAQQSVETPISGHPDVPVDEDLVSGRISSKEWSQVKPPLAHFASSTASTTSGSIPNLSSSADPADERKKSLATSVASSTSLNDSPTEGKAPTLYQAPGIVDRTNWTAASETNSVSDNSENVLIQDNVDVDWNADGDWGSRPMVELSASVSQLSLNSGVKTSQQHEPQAPQLHPPFANPQQTPTDESSPGLQSIPRNPVENSQSESHQEPMVESIHGAYQSSGVNAPETIAQTNYDQWYNQSSSQPQQAAGWYTNDRSRTAPQQWAPEQNVENYENIQQPSEFVNLEVVAPMQERDIYGSRDSINKETLENDPKPQPSPPKDVAANSRDSRQEASNVEVPAMQQIQQPVQTDQAPDNYEFASNDRNTFLETGELTDSHQEHESTPPCQDDENDEVPSDIPFLREVPGQSSSSDPRRNDPTGQEQYVQSSPRVTDPRRNDPSGQAQSVAPRNLPERTERRDVPPGQERSGSQLLSRGDNEILERRNDPSGRERSLPPSQSRNDPSGEERTQSQQTIAIDPSEVREVPGSGTLSEESLPPVDGALRQIPGGASPNEAAQVNDDRNNTRVVTGSQEVVMPGRKY